MSNLRIGQLARAADFTEKTLRFYDEIGLLRPSGRSASGYRLYDEQAIERLRFVRRAQGLGLSLDDMRTILEIGDEGRVPCGHVVSVVDRELARVDGQLRRLRSLRRDLVMLRGRLSDGIASGRAKPGYCEHLAKAPESSTRRDAPNHIR
ncbi:MAG: MerR family transcriptional regulator [Dehalococcoidia bacterium]|nr:MAG: MerR family transcriptional regulator [Dehalococcoidia bacterium]